MAKPQGVLTRLGMLQQAYAPPSYAPVDHIGGQRIGSIAAEQAMLAVSEREGRELVAWTPSLLALKLRRLSRTYTKEDGCLCTVLWEIRGRKANEDRCGTVASEYNISQSEFAR